jgi:arsenate reductase
MNDRTGRPLRVIRTVVPIISVATALVAASPQSQSQGSPAKSPRPPTILFMCPHGAAKSVLASAYFQRLAKERGLNVRVESAGTEPDAEVAPAVANHLTKNGYSIPVSKPRQVTASDLETADVVISMGCDLKGLPAPRGTLLRWDDVPGPSEDFAGADERIRKRVIELVDELMRKQGR